MDQYEIYWIDLGTGSGHEQSQQRPAIILKPLQSLDMCIVVPLTTKLESIKFQYTVQINRTTITNLQEDSVALVFQLRAIDKKRVLGNPIGKLGDYQVEKIKTELKQMFSL